jgi:sugar phosphate isomerase/epimerase
LRLGVSTSSLPDASLPETLRWAGEAGFESVEIPCRFSRGSEGWHEGPALRPEALDGPARDAFVTALDEAGLEAAALVCEDDLVVGDEARTEVAAEHATRTVETAGALGIPVVCLEAGRDPATPLGDAIAEFARRVAPVLEAAEAAGVRLAVSTDPACGRHFEDAPGTAAFCPELWEKLFTHVRSDSVGLAFDPSNLVWLGIDPVAAATDYVEKVLHVRGRDVEVFALRRQDCSVLRPGGGWWRHRLPGLGEIDWRRLLDRLAELNYEGSVAVWGGDPVWSGSAEKVRAGLARSRRHLARFLP